MYESQWPESARKRSRDDDEHGGITVNSSSIGFTEHRNKRLQSLPFRTSPTQKRWTDPPSFPGAQMPPPNAVTPSDSGSENWSSPMDPCQQPSQNPPMDMDRDTDMMAEDSCAPPQHLGPGPSHSDPSVSGRIPTPIHCSFAAQVRGNSWVPANQSAHIANQAIPEDQAVFIQQGHQQAFPSSRDDSVPRSLGGNPEWSMVQDRRLPSPISECGGEDTPSTPGMVLDSSCSPVMTNLQRPYLPHLPHSTNPASMLLHPNIRTPPRVSDSDADAGMTDADAPTPTSAPASPSPRGKFGHCRSKHTLNTWTLQPGMKKSFSIGYRADCEKCRMKIPGHFNHIIVS